MVKAKEWRMIGWDCPPYDWCKINSNGAFKTREGIAAGGGLLRDSNGKWIAGFVANLGHCSERWLRFGVHGILSNWHGEGM